MNKFFRKAIVLTLAGSALLYTGCTKDYSGDITALQKEVETLKNDTQAGFKDLQGQIDGLQQNLASLETAKQKIEKNLELLTNRVGDLETFKSQAQAKFTEYGEKFTELDGEIAGLKAGIEALQKADEQILAAIDAAKARIKDLEDNTYNKTEVDNKLEALTNWAVETFATKETVNEIASALGTLTGTVEAINIRLGNVEETLAGIVGDEIPGIKQSIEELRTELAGVKTTAETALTKAETALGEIEDLKETLKNYYTAAEVDALLLAMKTTYDAEILMLQEADIKLNERIDSLAEVTKKIEDDLATFVNQTNKKLADLEAKLDNEIALRLADSAANVAAHNELKGLIDAIDEAYQAADKALNERCDALENRCKAIEDRIEPLETEVGNLRTELNQAKEDIKANATEIDNIKKDIAAKYKEVMDKFDEVDSWLSYFYAETNWLWIASDMLASAAQRIQSVVFVPEYNDFRANVIKISLGQTPIKNIVSATFEVQPAEAIVYVDSLIKENAKGNAGIGLAVKELESRAVDADEVIYDVTVSILDDEEHPGRFVIEAVLDPEVFDEEIAISCVLGDYKVGKWEAGNALQSCFVGTYVADRIDLIGGYTWYDEVADEPLDDSLGVDFRIPYTDPFVDSLVFKSISEEISFRIGFNGVYKTLEDVAKALFIEVDVLTPVGEEAYWQTKDNTEQEVAENDPFELSDFAPETILNNITIPDNSDPEPKYIIDPRYVHYSTARKEVFLVNGELINPFAFVGAIITKNQVPAVTTDEVEIPWSFLHPVTVIEKYIAPEDIDATLAVAVTGEYDGSDENFTKGDEAFEPQHGESIEFRDNPVTFNAWIFEAEDAHYVAKTERFETESDEYEFDIPFVVKQRPDDRKVEIDLGELSDYKASLSTKAFMVAVAPAFKGEEDYFIGDADEYMTFVNTDEEELEKEKIDSLYNAYDNAMDFVVDSVYVNGEKVELPVQGNPIIVDLDYRPDTRTDFSYIQIEPGFLPYGAEVTVYGRYTAFEVNFDYEISFTTRVSPYTLILRPYDKYDPAKPRTIIVEGDDRIDPDLYTLKQMFYSVYLRVVDQAAWAQGVEQNPKEGDIAGADLKVRFSFSYEDFAEFDIEVDPENPGAAAEMRGFVSDGLGDPITETYEVTVETTDDKAYGWLDAAENLMWGTYNGRKVTVSAELIEDGISIQTLDEFYIETEKPIQLDASMIIDSDEFGNPLQRVTGYPLDINLTQNMIIGGILSRGEGDVPYYVANPKIFGYKDNNVAQESNEPEWVAGDLCPFYGLEMEFDWDNISGTINNYPTELNNPRDYTVNGNIITVTADNGMGSFVINIPVVLYYYLDYCGAKAERGNVTISIQQLGYGN